MSGAAAQPGEKILTDFSKPSDAGMWRSVNDGVMGGRSEGGARIQEDRLIFAGETRLENNGGFSSIRSAARDWSLGGARELVLRVRGAGSRGYTMLLETSATRFGMPVSYWQPFTLKGNDWEVVRLPLSSFYPTFRGERLKGPALDLPGIRSLGFMVYDKKAGPFQLEIDWIKGAWEAPVDEATAAPVVANDIVSVATSSGRFTTLLAAATAAGLVDTLTSPGPFTVLAPTDEAFAALEEGTVATLLKPENRDRLKGILLYHVIPGTLRSAELLSQTSVPTVQGQSVGFRIVEGRLTAGEARVILNDVEASNGIIHAIDRVLIPTASPAPSPVKALIELAVAKGVALFNAGDVDACADVYEVTVSALVQLEAPGLSESAKSQLAAALDAARTQPDRRAAAWELRRALDGAWAGISE